MHFALPACEQIPLARKKGHLRKSELFFECAGQGWQGVRNISQLCQDEFVVQKYAERLRHSSKNATLLTASCVVLLSLPPGATHWDRTPGDTNPGPRHPLNCSIPLARDGTQAAKAGFEWFEIPNMWEIDAPETCMSRSHYFATALLALFMDLNIRGQSRMGFANGLTYCARNHLWRWPPRVRSLLLHYIYHGLDVLYWRRVIVRIGMSQIVLAAYTKEWDSLMADEKIKDIRQQVRTIRVHMNVTSANCRIHYLRSCILEFSSWWSLIEISFLSSS